MHQIVDINEIIENIVSLIEQDQTLNRELARAKEIFFEKAGKINITTHSYQDRVNCFLNWFLFDWESNEQTSIYKIIISRFGTDKLSPIHYQLFPHSHSIFCLLKVKSTSYKVLDLFHKRKYLIQKEYFFQGMEKYSCFESRLYYINKNYIFSNYVILHPIETSSYIQKKVKDCKGSSEKFKSLFFKLHKAAHKYETYKHFPIKNIYT